MFTSGKVEARAHGGKPRTPCVSRAGAGYAVLYQRCVEPSSQIPQTLCRLVREYKPEEPIASLASPSRHRSGRNTSSIKQTFNGLGPSQTAFGDVNQKRSSALRLNHAVLAELIQERVATRSPSFVAAATSESGVWRAAACAIPKTHRPGPSNASHGYRLSPSRGKIQHPPALLEIRCRISLVA